MMETLQERLTEISPSTLAVIGEREEGDYLTKVMEYDEEDDYETTHSAQKVMDITCREFGISLRGLIEGSRMLTGITHKPPIAIDRMSGMYFFPVESPLRKSCSWIAHSHVQQAEKLERNRSKIIFKNNRTITLDISYATIINQIYRTAQYRYLLGNKMEDVLQLSHYVAESGWKRKEPGIKNRHM